MRTPRLRSTSPEARVGAAPLTSVWTGYLLAGPALVVMIAIFIYPLGYSFVMSFFRWDMSASSAPFIGFGNYEETFASRSSSSRCATSLYSLPQPSRSRFQPAWLGGADQRRDARPEARADALAHSADDRTRCRRPQLPLAVQHSIWLHRHAARRSPSARDPLAFRSGLGAVSIIIADVWQNTPLMVLLFLAGLQSLPQEPLEAAAVDGASAWQIFWTITLPLLRPVIVIALMLRIIDTFRTFDVVWLMTQGGPGAPPA